MIPKHPFGPIIYRGWICGFPVFKTHDCWKFLNDFLRRERSLVSEDPASGGLPSDACYAASIDFVQTSTEWLRQFITAEGGDQSHRVLVCSFIMTRNGVDIDSLFGSFYSQGTRKTKKSQGLVTVVVSWIHQTPEDEENLPTKNMQPGQIRHTSQLD